MRTAATEVRVRHASRVATRGTGGGRAAGGPAAAPPPPDGAIDRLLRSDAELVAAHLATEPADRLVHAHLAALRAGAAVLAARGVPGRRRHPRPVWDMLGEVAPELAEWAAWFAAGAPARAAAEAGRRDVTPDQAERTVAAAEDFQDAVRAVLDPAGIGQLVLRAS